MAHPVDEQQEQVGFFDRGIGYGLKKGGQGTMWTLGKYGEGLDWTNEQVNLRNVVSKNTVDKEQIKDLANKIAKFHAGFYVHANRLFGYKKINVENQKGKVIGKKLAECDDNGKHLKMMFKIFAKTGKTRDVQDYLRKNNVLTQRGNKKNWKGETIRKILSNE